MRKLITFPGAGDYLILALILIVAISFKLEIWISVAAGTARLISTFTYTGMHYPRNLNSYAIPLLISIIGCIILTFSRRSLSDYIVLYLVTTFSLEIIFWLLSAIAMKATKN
jgi:hypothetical protein